MKQFQKANIDGFKAHFRGEVVLPDDADYNEVRQIWNAMIDRKPSLIARCSSPEDIVEAVNFAREHERIESAYGATYHRLREIKTKYDPTNLFRMNQNIKPV